jgi:hypothetical protein
MKNIDQIKSRLSEYLELNDVKIYGKGKNKKIYCLVHSENNPSAQLNQKSIVCHGCGAKYDVFDCASFLNFIDGFKNQLKHVCETLGESYDENFKNVKHEKRKPLFRVPVEHTESVCLKIDVARKVYCISRLNDLAEYAKIDGKFVKAWPYMTINGLVKCVDVRYENKDGKKSVVTVWYNGKEVQMSNPPNCIWGLDHIDYRKPALILEGAKCASLAHENLESFCCYTWNRGTNAVRYPNWDPIKKHESIYFLYDHDEKADNKGVILCDEDQPGMKCALELKKIIPKLQLINIPDFVINELGDNRDGADLEQMIEYMTSKEIEEYILE